MSIEFRNEMLERHRKYQERITEELRTSGESGEVFTYTGYLEAHIEFLEMLLYVVDVTYDKDANGWNIPNEFLEALMDVKE